MTIQIITSSYPAYRGDPGGTAGLFVQTFALELVAQGHQVIVQPVARKASYQPEEGIILEPIPWSGGDQELASMNFFNPFNWLVLIKFILAGRQATIAVSRKYPIDRILCMWAVPSGLFGFWINKKYGTRYDVWALGSDIWKIRKIPLLGNLCLKTLMHKATGVFADGVQLAQDVSDITGKACRFLPSSRTLPEPQPHLPTLGPPEICQLLFVGRYHPNKGPDLLLKALALVPTVKRDRLKVHMFGAGPMESYLKKLCLDLNLYGTVALQGPIDAQGFADYLSRVSYLIIPSRTESIPLVFSDALQAHTPVIATPVGDLPHLISKYEYGLLAKDTTPAAIANAIEKSLDRDGQQKIPVPLALKNLFDIPKIVKEWLKT